MDVGAITRFTPTSIPDEFDAEIFAMNADGSSEVQVTNSTGVLGNGQGSWSPLGTKIVVSSDRDANTEIYAVNVVGSGETRLTKRCGVGRNAGLGVRSVMRFDQNTSRKHDATSLQDFAMHP